MARPQREGLEYFPIDVDIDQDDKVALVEAEYGIRGFGVLVKLLAKIYKEGYFYTWGDKERILFAQKVGLEVAEVSAIVESALKWGFFDQRLYDEYGILTSRGIQRRYWAATSRRKEVRVIEEYWLLEPEERANLVIVDINGAEVYRGKQKQEQKQERQEEKQEVVKTRRPRSPFKSLKQQELFDAFWTQYPKKRSKGAAEKRWSKISPDDELYKDIMEGLERARRSQDWHKDGGQFIPYPATWLNAKGWEDEYTPSIRGGGQSQESKIVVPF